MQISNVNAHAAQYAQNLKQNSAIEGSPAEEANESAVEKAAEAQKKAAAQSTGLGTKIDLTA